MHTDEELEEINYCLANGILLRRGVIVAGDEFDPLDYGSEPEFSERVIEAGEKFDPLDSWSDTELSQNEVVNVCL